MRTNLGAATLPECEIRLVTCLLYYLRFVLQFDDGLDCTEKYDVILEMAAEFRANPDIFFDSLVQKYEAAQTSEDSGVKAEHDEPVSAIAEPLSDNFDGLQVQEIPLEQLLPFPNHPYHVELDADMEELIESIREHGITTPAIVKPTADAPGIFTLISGHRRKFACEQLGLEHLLCLIRDFDDDEATIAMVESNKHRSKILPSEKAFAYSMQLDAMKRKAGRPERNSSQLAINYNGKQTSKILGESVGESHDQIYRFIRLTHLIKPLLELVDKSDAHDSISFAVGGNLSYLKKVEQERLDYLVAHTHVPRITVAQSKRLRELSGNHELTDDALLEVLAIKKPPRQRKLFLTEEQLLRYFPNGTTFEQAMKINEKLLDDYKRRWQYAEKQKERMTDDDRI